MPERDSLADIEQQKIDLVKLRIKNNYYNRADILKQVVSEIVQTEIKKNPEF